MNFRSFNSRRRGISPVIATVLIIALVVAAAAVVWVVTQNLLSTGSGGEIVIENVGVADKSGNDLGDFFLIVARNIGADPVEVDGIVVKINDQTAESWVIGSTLEINSKSQVNFNASTISSSDMVTNQDSVEIYLTSGDNIASNRYDVRIPGILASEAILYESGSGLSVQDLQVQGWVEHRLNTGSHGGETSPVFTVTGSDEITVGSNNNDYLYVLENDSYSAQNFIFSSQVTNNDDDMVGFVFRFQDVNNYYWLGYTNNHHSAGNTAGDPVDGNIPYADDQVNRWVIGKVIDGSTEIIGSGPLDASFNGNNAGTQQATVQLVANEDTFIVSIDGQEILTVQDTSISTTGYLGLISIAAQNCLYGDIIIQR